MILALLLTLNLNASDKHFKIIQPVDNIVTNMLEWRDHQLAADISDVTQLATIGAPFVYLFVDAIKGDEFKKDKMLAVFGATGVNYGLTGLAKWIAKRTRPNGENTKSFWSGHSSSSFTGAGLMCLLDGPGTLCSTTLALAGVTGYLRIAARKHWISDVLVGAGVGYAHGRYFPTLFWRF